MGNLVVILGAIFLILGNLWLLITIFKDSIMWGVGCLVFGPLTLLWIILNWDLAKTPTLFYLGGVGIIFLGIFLGADIQQNA